MTKPSTSSSKCGTCKKIVKDGDKSGIACDNCAVWYHGACAKLSQEDVTLMGRIKGCLWLCDSCLNDDAFNSEAKYNPIIDAKIMKSGMKQIQNSLTEIKSALRPSPEPVKIIDHDYSLSREVIINGLVEEKGDFNSTFEADNSKLQSVFNHMEEASLNIDSTRRLGKPKGDTSRPRPLLVRFTSEWDARKCLYKSYKLQSFHERVFLSQRLNNEDQ